MPAPYGVGTTVTHQPQDAQGNNAGAPWDAIWKEGAVEAYFPQPGTPPGNDYKKIVGVWNEVSQEVVFPTFEVVYQGATYRTMQGNIVNSHGTAVAVA